MQSTSATNAASDALSQKDGSAGCPSSRRGCEKWVLHRVRSRPRLSSGNLYPTSAKNGQKWGTRPDVRLRVLRNGNRNSAQDSSYGAFISFCHRGDTNGCCLPFCHLW